LMSLTQDQIRSFEQSGVLKLEQAVPPDLLRTACELVNGWMGDGFDRSRLEEYTNRTFAPELGTDPRLLAVFNESRLRSDCESLIGPEGFDPVRTVQIALRVPAALTPGVTQPIKPMHVDGVYCSFLPAGDLRTFTLNVGVMLDDVPDSQGGALHYVPAGHKRMAQWLRDGGTPTPETEAPEDIAKLPGRPLCGKAGDAVILHHLVPHRVGTNHTSHLRSMLYFRVKHVDHERLKLEALTDPWIELPGVRAAAP
jgi:hypothetical protein